MFDPRSAGTTTMKQQQHFGKMEKPLEK